jgi:hypothetical protein
LQTNDADHDDADHDDHHGDGRDGKDEGGGRGRSVVFWAQDGEKRVRCEIIRDARDDHFGGGKELLAVFRANRRAIEEIARRKYLSGRTEADESVLIGSEDI